MTILPKKIATQGKSEVENTDSGSHHGGTHHSFQISLGTMPTHSQTAETVNRERLYVTGHNSPPCWTPSASREEKRPAHSSPTRFDDFDSLESGPSHSKRRRRASPHRSVRNKHREREHRDHRERNNPSPTFPSTSSGVSGAIGNSSPIAGPSGLVGGSDELSGYNSGDEYGAFMVGELSEEEINEREHWFEKKMKKKGLIIKKMSEDGACLFRAVADQVYGDQEMHTIVRKHCMDYIAANADYYSQYVTEDFNTYVERKRVENVHGNHIEIQAMSEMYNRTIEVFCYSTEPINIFHGVEKPENEPIKLSYHRGIHYNSLVDPYKATVGVGLGLPGLTPGLADKNLLRDAARQSEDFHIEQAMLEDKMKATDWEATNEAIEEQVARESYLQWLKDNEKRNKSSHRSATATSSSATVTSGEMRSPRSRTQDCSSPSHVDTHRNSPRSSPRNSPKATEVHYSPTTNTNTSPKMGFHEDGAIPSSSASCFSSLQWERPNNSPKQCEESGTKQNDNFGLGSGFQLLETASFLNQLPPGMFGLTEWEDAGILAQVLAASQQEYLDKLKKSKDSKKDAKDCNDTRDASTSS